MQSNIQLPTMQSRDLVANHAIQYLVSYHANATNTQAKLLE